MINLYIIDYHNFNTTNGLSTYVAQLGKGLYKAQNIQLHYVWVKDTSHKDFVKKNIKGIVNYYIPKEIALSTDSSGFDQKAARFLADEMLGKENIIVHFNWINHCAFAYLLKQNVNCKTILTKHCIPWRDLITNNYSAFLGLDRLYNSKEQKLSIMPLKLSREQLAYRAMDHVICVTKSGKRSLQRMLNYSEENCSVIYNGIDASEMEMVKRNRLTLRKHYGIALDEKIILYAGSVKPSKGAYDLVRVFDRLCEEHSQEKWRLVIAGGGNYNGLLKNISRNWAKITLTGKLNKSQLYDFYALADIGVVPSYIEQCSYSAIEMMFAGLPLIVADVDGLKEIVPNDSGLLVKLKLGKESARLNEKDFKEKLLYFLKNETEAKKYSTNCQAHAKRTFTMNRMVKETIQLYEKLLIDQPCTHMQEDDLSSLKETGKEVLVSVVLHTYKGDDFLKESIDSVLGQTWQNLELIVVDNYSTNDNAEIVKSYEDTRLRYEKNNKNKDVVHSLNKGISLTNGRYIICIDAGNRISSDRIYKQLQFLEKNPEVAIVGSWNHVIDFTGKVIKAKTFPITDEEIKLLLPFINPFSHASVMMRAKVIKELKYSNEYIHCEDYELWKRMANKYKMANLPEFLTEYRIPRQDTRERKKEKKQSMLVLLSVMLEDNGIEHTAEDLSLHAALTSPIAEQYVNRNDKMEAAVVWIERLLKHTRDQLKISTTTTKCVQEFILYNLYGINPKLLKKKNLKIRYETNLS